MRKNGLFAAMHGKDLSAMTEYSELPPLTFDEALVTVDFGKFTKDE